MHADDARRPPDRGRGPRRSAAARCCGCATSAASSASSPSCRARHQKLIDDIDSLRTLIDALPSPVWARDVAGALDLRQRRLCARGRGQGRRRRDRARHRTARPRRARRSCSARATAAKPMPAGCPAIVAGSAPHLRRARRADPPRQRRHRHRRHRSRDACAPSSTRMVDAHRRTLDQLATGVAIFGADQQADLLQRGLSLAVGPRRRLPRPGPDRFRRARPAARRAQAARGAGFPRNGRPQLHEAYRATRSQGAHLAPARRPHAARRHHAQSGRRRDLSVRRRHRAARSRAALRRADPRAGRDARQSRRSGRGVRQRRPAAAAQSGLRAHVEARRRQRWPSGRTSRP